MRGDSSSFVWNRTLIDHKTLFARLVFFRTFIRCCSMDGVWQVVLGITALPRCERGWVNILRDAWNRRTWRVFYLPHVISPLLACAPPPPSCLLVLQSTLSSFLSFRASCAVASPTCRFEAIVSLKSPPRLSICAAAPPSFALWRNVGLELRPRPCRREAAVAPHHPYDCRFGQSPVNIASDVQPRVFAVSGQTDSAGSNMTYLSVYKAHNLLAHRSNSRTC